jgi:phosphoglycolate phosphatase-like HAD superfamily hydrolase
MIVLLLFCLLFVSLTRADSGSGLKKVTLVTFDVDGTLVQGSSDAAAKSVHSRAFNYGVGKVYGASADWFDRYTHPTSVIPSEKYHGCTDGLIALNIAKYGLDLYPSETHSKLQDVFAEMFDFVASHSDEDVASGIEALPGVRKALSQIAMLRDGDDGDCLFCGLVTGNVEGIARKKMRAVGILQTQALSPPSEEQLLRTWAGYEDCAFLGGFGSDYCSGDVEDQSRIYKDRGEQLKICVQRCINMLDSSTHELTRVVHVGDAVADVLAAKWCRESLDASIRVGVVGVATGKWSVEQLTAAISLDIPGSGVERKGKGGVFESIVLEDGINDPDFLEYCFPGSRGRL